MPRAIHLSRFFLIFIGITLLTSPIIQAMASAPAWKVKRRVSDVQEQVLKVENISNSRLRSDEIQIVRDLPSEWPEGAPVSRERYVETLYGELAFKRLIATDSEVKRQYSRNSTSQVWPGSEVRTLVNQGPTSNRVNLTIVGDGYTESERDRFFADAQRIANGLFVGPTFRSYLPLFNVHAVFVPSLQSGLTDVEARDTALGLFRSPAGSKRAIMVGKPDAAERALALAPATDYPILLANDDYYGGLGGRFAITTRSIESGELVLRHELGHNFGQVGEEYDGGYVYSGANFSSHTRTTWRHWAASGQISDFTGQLLTGEYVWLDLSQEAYRSRFDFPSPGAEGPWLFDFKLSTVGLETSQDVNVTLDGNAAELEGVFTRDRSFFAPRIRVPLAPGVHEFLIQEQIADGDNVLARLQAHAYPPTYDFTPDRIGAFATYDDSGLHVGYRPTHESCLMRNMRIEKFCVVDQENMWKRFLSRISLVDTIRISATQNGNSAVELLTPALPAEQVDIRWFKRNAEGEYVELTDIAGQRSWSAAPDANGRYQVRVRFATPEVRLPASFRSEEGFTL